ncbi:MAG: haloacid dehalogenase [Pelodictyon luteolum]|uniref:Haloacid dehalogenase n=1 Tax=Pelodictyon luteolum TaxID=1100 RepID=A0A165M376_PELLU|nr:HAD family phosphatase [Pelodictyon luteolum]KZK74759.1 MAG: haloacid dehalogenase [Pelodictyon luteolum]
MKELLLLDNDGLLLDTERLFFDVTKEFFRESGLEITEALWAREYLGNAKRSLQIAIELGMQEDDAGDMLRRRNSRYMRCLQGEVPVRPGVSETLSFLSGKVRLAMVTGSPRDQVLMMHRHTGLLDHFELIIADDDVERPKPHPEPYSKALETLGVDPCRALAVEDSLRGFNSAHAAGIDCVIVQNSLTRLQRFSGALAVEDEFLAVLRHLGLSLSVPVPPCAS